MGRDCRGCSDELNAVAHPFGSPPFSHLLYNVQKLAVAGILREVTGRQRGRIYLAEGVAGAVSGENGPIPKRSR